MEGLKISKVQARGGFVGSNNGCTINNETHYHNSTAHQDLLGQLDHAPDAPFDSYAKRREVDCLNNTRVGLRDEIHDWADGQDGRCVFWLSGMAGTGKSTIARTVARRYYTEKRLAASFFFSRGGGDVGHARKFVRSISFQLAHNVPASCEHICNAIAGSRDIVNKELNIQWDHLVLRPLSKLHEPPGPYIIVVDALDECDDKDISLIVKLLVDAQSLTRVRLRVLLTSRPEGPIRHNFKPRDSEYTSKNVVLHNISPSIIDHDIQLFFENRFRIIAEECNQADGWPGLETIGQLVQSASGLFIWAATACRFIQEGGPFAADRLRTVFKDTSSTDSTSSEDSSIDERFEILPEQRLDSIYLTVLKSPIIGYRRQEKRKWYTLIRETLGPIVILKSPLSTSSLAQLLHVSVKDVHRALDNLHSIIDVPQDPNQPLRLHHPSFRDFLLNRKRCNGDSFWVEKRSMHEKLASYCLQLMSTLRQNICNLSNHDTLRSEIREETIAGSLPPELQYACRYWVEHLECSQQNMANTVDIFLRTHLLHWLEAMSLIGETEQCVLLLARLQMLVASPTSSYASFLRDAIRFILRFQSILAEAPLQVYMSALVFAPEKSIVRNIFANMVPRAINVLSGGDTDWDACRSVLEGHLRKVNAVAFSLDGQLIASASDDTTVRVWETATGMCRRELTGHVDRVTTVVFSKDGQLLASASHDKTVRVWEIATGRCRNELKGHSHLVTNVMFSANGELVASMSPLEKTVRVWKTATGEPHGELQGHTSYVTAVAFSSDGQLLASASYDGTVRVWETAKGRCHRVLKGHIGRVTTVVFSTDGQLLASVSNNKTVRMWEVTGKSRGQLRGHTDCVTAVKFSADGQLLISVSRDSTVWAWETATGKCRNVLNGHTALVTRVAFSADGQLLMSVSRDKTVRALETATGKFRDELGRVVNAFSAVAFSTDGQLLALASRDNIVRVWETVTGKCRSVLKGHTALVTAAAFSPDGQLLISASQDNTVRMWDTTIGICNDNSVYHSSHVTVVNFSPDGQLIASASRDKTVRFWETATGMCRSVLEDQSSDITRLSFLPDDKVLYTNQGEIPLPPDLGPISVPEKGMQALPLSAEKQWVLYKRQRLLWLPFEYRPHRTAMYEDMICLGCPSGRVVLLRIQ